LRPLGRQLGLGSLIWHVHSLAAFGRLPTAAC